jgi:hypothetical protein
MGPTTAISAGYLKAWIAATFDLLALAAGYDQIQKWLGLVWHGVHAQCACAASRHVLDRLSFEFLVELPPHALAEHPPPHALFEQPPPQVLAEPFHVLVAPLLHVFVGPLLHAAAQVLHVPALASRPGHYPGAPR